MSRGSIHDSYARSLRENDSDALKLSSAVEEFLRGGGAVTKLDNAGRVIPNQDDDLSKVAALKAEAKPVAQDTNRKPLRVSDLRPPEKAPAKSDPAPVPKPVNTEPLPQKSPQHTPPQPMSEEMKTLYKVIEATNQRIDRLIAGQKMSVSDHRKEDGSIDGVGVMSEVTGVSRSEILSIWEQVKENQLRLSICSWHEFEEIYTAPPSQAKYRCRHCRGEIDSSAYRWHQIGRRPMPVGEPRP